jgi:hypothetical protein
MRKIFAALLIAVLTAASAHAQIGLPIGPGSGGGGGGGGSGTVTSVATTCGTSGGPITTTGTISGTLPIRSVVGTSDTVLAADCGGAVEYSNVGAGAVTLPQAGSAGFAAGYYTELCNVGSGLVTVTPTTSTIDPGTSAGAASITIAQYACVGFKTDGVNYFTSRGRVPNGVFTVNGALKGNGAGVVSQAASTDLSDTALLARLASPALTGTPTAPTQSAGDNTTAIATDAFVTTAVNNAIAGVNPAVAVNAATTAAADTSGCTYANGASGIGATLTCEINTVKVIDGFTFNTITTQSLLVKNDTQSPSGAFNGIYVLTVLHTAGTGDIYTRRLDYDQPSDMNNTGAIPVISGTVNGTTSWLLTSNITTVGTSPLTYTQFSLNPTTTVVGPASATDGHLALFNGSTGKLIKDGGGLGTGVATALGNPIGGASGVALSDLPALYVTSNWYLPKGILQISGGGIAIANTMYCFVGGVTQSVVIKALAVATDTGQTGGTVEGAIYTVTAPAGVLTFTLFDFSTVVGTATGTAAITLGTLNNTTDTLVPGTLYGFCTASGASTTMPTFVGVVAAVASAGQLVGSATLTNVISTGNASLSGFSTAITYNNTTPSSTFPGSFTAPTAITTGKVPVMAFQVN